MAHLDPARATDITGSDVPTICGENPFSNGRDVFMKKCLDLPSFSCKATEHGHKYEPMALARFERETGARIWQPGYMRCSTAEWLGGTVDSLGRLGDGGKHILDLQAMCPDIDLRCQDFVVEVKCPISRKIEEDYVPTHYIGQVQTYMHIWNSPVCFFVQYKPAHSTARKTHEEQFVVTAIRRDLMYMNSRIPKLYKFWTAMTAGKQYVIKVVTYIQRAWRARRIFKGLAALRLKSANTLARMHGYAQSRAQMARVRHVPPMERGICYVDDSKICVCFVITEQAL